MLDIYDIIINYMRQTINQIYDSLKTLNVEINDLQEFLYALDNNDFNFHYNKELFERIYPNNTDLYYKKFEETIFILERVDYNKLILEPQIIDMLNYLKEIKKGVFSLINKKIKEFDTLKEDYLKKKEKYHKYIQLINGDSLCIQDDTLKEEFYDFLRNSNIDKELVKYIIERLSSKRIINISDKEVKDKVDISNLPRLSAEIIKKILNYQKIFDKLALKEKNSIISASELVIQNEFDDLQNIAYGFSKEEIIYYVSIYLLLNLYNNYNELYAKDNLNDAKTSEELFGVLELSLEDVIKDIMSNLEKLQNMELALEKNDDEENLQTSHNLVLFLDIGDFDKNGKLKMDSITNTDINYIIENFGGNTNDYVKQIIRMLKSRLIEMPNSELRSLGHDANKRIINPDYKMLKEFDIWSMKGRGNNPARVTYCTLSVSEKNKKELIEMYNLSLDTNIYLVIGLFIKLNDDSEYVRITHNRLIREEGNIHEIQNIFREDFNDLTRYKAIKLINRSYDMFEKLNASFKQVSTK